MGEKNIENIISYLNNKLEHKTDYVALIKDLKNECNFKELELIYKYLLESSSNNILLNHLIRDINTSKNKNCLPFLIVFILRQNNDNDFLNLKVLAIKTISNFKDTSSVTALMYCLNNKNSNYKIRLAAAEALGKIGDKNAFDTLGSIACDEKEKSTYVKESAVIALGMLGDKRALKVFNSIINTKQMFLSKFSYLKERIVEAMSKLDIEKDDLALDILKKSLLDPSERVRIGTIETLMNSNINQSYELIYERLKFDDSLEVKKNALVALYNISDRRILDEVINSDFCNELKNYAKEIITEYEENNE